MPPRGRHTAQPPPDPRIDEWQVDTVEPVAYRHLANLAQQLQSSLHRNGVSLDQSNPHSRQRKAEREIVSRSLGGINRFLNVAQRNVVSQNDTVLNRRAICDHDTDGLRHGIGFSRHHQGAMKIVAPTLLALCPPSDRPGSVGVRQWRAHKEIPSGRIAIRQIDDYLR